MKKYIVFLLFFAFFALAANQDMQKGNKQERASNQMVTITDVQAAFAQEGLSLEGWYTSQHFYTLKGVVPIFYKAGTGEFAIYVFRSDEDRVKGREDFDVQTATAKVALSNIYEVRNILIFEFRSVAQNELMKKVIDALYGSAKSSMLSIDDVKIVLQQQAVELIPSDFYYDWFKLGLKTEYSFDVNGKEQLYVYVFDSVEAVEMGLKQINVQNAKYDIAHTPMPFKVNNVLIMYIRYLPIPGVEDKLQGAVDVWSDKDSTIKRVLSEPPLPIISVEGKRVTVVRGSSCWEANNIGKCSDRISPPELVKKITPTIASAGSRVNIQFEYRSNELGINQWMEGGVKNVVLEQDNTFTLPREKGIYVFDVYGHWKEGSSSFAFAVEVQ